MTIKHIIFVTVAVCFCTVSQAQRNTGYDNYNRIGIQGGLSIFDIKTNDLITESRTGVTGGFTTRGAFRNNFDFIYGLNFLSNQIRVRGVNSLPTGGVLDTQLIELSLKHIERCLLREYWCMSSS